MGRRRVKVRGIRREEIDTDTLALAYWLMAKHAMEEKRRQQSKDDAARDAAREGSDAKR